MHTPNPGSDPRPDQQDDDVRRPPLPPDRQDEIVPVEEPPQPGRTDVSPMRAARRRTGGSRVSPMLVAAAVMVFGSMMTVRDAKADIFLTQRGCMMYATWSGNLVWARDIGADKEKARAELLALDQKRPSSIYALMLRELDALWTTSASWEQVTALVLQDCLGRMGRYESGA